MSNLPADKRTDLRVALCGHKGIRLICERVGERLAQKGFDRAGRVSDVRLVNAPVFGRPRCWPVVQVKCA
jgi:hypothetical protein